MVLAEQFLEVFALSSTDIASSRAVRLRFLFSRRSPNVPTPRLRARTRDPARFRSVIMRGDGLPSSQMGRSRKRCHCIEFFLAQRREEEVISGDPVRMHRLDRVRRVNKNSG